MRHEPRIKIVTFTDLRQGRQEWHKTGSNVFSPMILRSKTNLALVDLLLTYSSDFQTARLDPCELRTVVPYTGIDRATWSHSRLASSEVPAATAAAQAGRSGFGVQGSGGGFGGAAMASAGCPAAAALLLFTK
ncbi:hypothetical protein EVAR_100440_1 [Eumeta japonica]|uniref:Uncharacterized protein n=1 Tax=Eumeta variegata TaxID=151549 RepID=A0A4C1SE49_EUMVA|nr:hypothetical protein EVAR_100440_1 [Eumeta japonica]